MAAAARLKPDTEAAKSLSKEELERLRSLGLHPVGARDGQHNSFRNELRAGLGATIWASRFLRT